MEILKAANLGLRFLLELCLLAALDYWGFRAGNGPVPKLLLGLGAPLLAALFWGTFIAPKARVRLAPLPHLAGEVAIFALAVAALAAAGQPRLAAIFASAALASRLLLAV